ncbi:MAG: hypothetical protein GY847_24305 [Proteobacteria bacterium]|nr:hypothetical protein [Pseudomonadota bacterium]
MIDSRKPYSKKDGRLIAFAVALGVLIIGVFALLFAMVNNTWVVINVPNAPWSPRPTLAAFEAKMWGILLVCLAIGASVSGLVVFFSGFEQRRIAAQYLSRVTELEAELENVKRLLAVTRLKR